MTVRVSEMRETKDRRCFLTLPWIVHRHHPKWVPPLLRDDRRFFDPKRNNHFRHCLTTLALARRDGTPCGRIMGIVDARPQRRGERTARFGFLECDENAEAFHALLAHVEGWARAHGMNRLVGPMGFTDQDPEGFVLEGFEHDPAIASYWNPPYVNRFLEAEGYVKEVDYVVYRLRISEALTEAYAAVERRLARYGAFRLLEFARRRELRPVVVDILRLMGETFRDAYGFDAPDEEEMRALAREWLPVIDPRFVKVVTRQNALVGFIVGMPCLAEGLRAANGRLLPFGLLRILRAARRARRLDLLVGGVREDCRGRGVDALLGGALFRSAWRAGFAWLDSHHEQETNLRMRAEMERVGGEVYKRYRIYAKSLTARVGE